MSTMFMRRALLVLVCLAGLSLGATAQTPPAAQTPTPQTSPANKPAPTLQSFPTPDAAAQTLTEALRKDDDKTIRAILGAGWRDLVPGTTEDEDEARAKYLAAWDENHKIVLSGDDKAQVEVGKTGFLMAIPIVKQDGVWRFDVAAGQQELQARFIGRNEYRAIQTLLAERVLIEGDEFGRLGGDAAFRNRLDPIALAFHRGFNVGGYVPEAVDRTHPPAIEKEVRESRSVDLASETMAGLPTSLEQCLAGRQSIRAYAGRPMEQEDLAQFLQLTARSFAMIETPDLGRLSMRNYPSGGARYPLEVYPIAYDVNSVEPGIYYYHPFHHRLLAMDSEAVYRDRPEMAWGVTPTRWFVQFTDDSVSGGAVAELPL